MNYRQIFAKKNERKKQIKQLCPTIQDTSGIYMFYRWSEEKQKWCVYIGQSQASCLERCASHLNGYKSKNPSHIDKSLKNHGIYDKNNLSGWKLKMLKYCEPQDCNYWEQHFIARYRQIADAELYNITIGSQGEGKVDFQERSQERLKRYKNGKDKGRNAVLKQVKTYFDKYLDAVIKEPTNKIKEKKLKEFMELLEGVE